jgi:peptidylprolyl isomerase
MKKQNIIVILVVAAAILGLLGYQQGLNPANILSQLQGTGNSSGSTTTPGLGSPGASVQGDSPGQQDWVQGSKTSLGLNDIQLVLANVDVNQKRSLLEDETAFRDFVRQEATQISLLAAASANQIAEDTNAKFLIQRGTENIIRQIYLNKLIGTKIPADFPSEEQINQYYETNKENLVVEERLSVWQIFMPISAIMSADEISALESQASQIVNDIKQGRTDFTTAAMSYSQHQPSKLNGGYMGILKVSELIPGIHEALMELDEGEVSAPVKTEMGYHILKRDRIIPSQGVTLDMVRGQIKNLLINQARAKLSNDVQALAAETYPVEVDEMAIEEWRIRLQSEM